MQKPLQCEQSCCCRQVKWPVKEFNSDLPAFCCLKNVGFACLNNEHKDGEDTSNIPIHTPIYRKKDLWKKVHIKWQ